MLGWQNKIPARDIERQFPIPKSMTTVMMSVPPFPTACDESLVRPICRSLRRLCRWSMIAAIVTALVGSTASVGVFRSQSAEVAETAHPMGESADTLVWVAAGRSTPLRQTAWGWRSIAIRCRQCDGGEDVVSAFRTPAGCASAEQCLRCQLRAQLRC